jgi:carbonic anhydrase/acetyltransferase-like protein (isoleucine patch superfamily)
MILEHEGKRPTIHPDSRIAPTATICGDVTVGANCSVGFGAILVAESGPIVLRENVVVMDLAIVRGIAGSVTKIESNVLIGPRASLAACIIERDAFVATGATIFNRAVVGERAEVRINGIVHVNTIVPPDGVVPIGWIAVGNPAQFFAPGDHDALWAVQRELDFPGTVFRVPRPKAGETFMPDVMARYARRLREGHREDRPYG